MTQPFVGQAATIVLYTDTLPAVVTKVNAKSVVVRRVATTDPVPATGFDGPLPVMVADGLLDQPIGEPERYKLVGHDSSGTPRYANGSVRLRLGHSRKATDYRY